MKATLLLIFLYSVSVLAKPSNVAKPSNTTADVCKKSFSSFYLTDKERDFFQPLDIVFLDPNNIIKPCKQGLCIGFELFHNGQFIKEVNMPAEFLIGMAGYAHVAKEYFKGDMYLANFILSTQISAKEYQKLHWIKYHGPVEKFLKIRQMISNQNGQLKETVIGPIGLLSVGEKYFKGDLRTTFREIWSVLNYRERKQINWIYFDGNNVEFRNLRHRLLNKKNELQFPFNTSNGFLHILKLFPKKKSMDQIFINVLSALGSNNFYKLSFPMFIGFPTDFYSWKKDFLLPNGELNPKYIGSNGLNVAVNYYAHQVQDFLFPYYLTKDYQNTMPVSQTYTHSQDVKNSVIVKNRGFVYYNVLAVLGPEKFAQLDWPELHPDFVNGYKAYFLNKGYTKSLFKHFDFFK